MNQLEQNLDNDMEAGGCMGDDPVDPKKILHDLIVLHTAKIPEVYST